MDSADGAGGGDGGDRGDGEEEEEEVNPGHVARQALACLQECAADAAAYRASEQSEPPPPSTVRRTHCSSHPASPHPLLP